MNTKTTPGKHPLASICLTSSLLICSSAIAQPPPNILFIFMEDMGLRIGPYGDTTAPTPRLDALAKEGVVFENAHCTQPTCSPSRSSVFTGLYPHQNGHMGLAHSGGFFLKEGIDPFLKHLMDAQHDADFRERLFTEYTTHCPLYDYAPARAIQDGRYKLIHHLLAGVIQYPKDGVHADILEKLKKELLAWRKETDDPFLDAGYTERFTAHYFEHQDRVRQWQKETPDKNVWVTDDVIRPEWNSLSNEAFPALGLSVGAGYPSTRMPLPYLYIFRISAGFAICRYTVSPIFELFDFLIVLLMG